MVETRKRLSDDDVEVGGKRHNLASGQSNLKVLVPNFMAGKLIGKGGSNIGELQSKFDLRIQINSNKEFYPGTSDRVVCVSGDVYEGIPSFLEYLIDLVDVEMNSERVNSTLSNELKLVITDIAAGLIIGKGGEQIKQIISQTNGANINISKKDESVTGERLLRVSGNSEQRKAACIALMGVMSTAPDKISNSNVKYDGLTASNAQIFNIPHISDMTGVNGLMLGNTNQTGMMCGNYSYKPKSQIGIKFTGEMEMPDALAGNVIGPGGRNISEITRTSGARLQMSKKDESNDGIRSLTITGDIDQVHKAYMLVDERLAEMEQRLR